MKSRFFTSLLCFGIFTLAVHADEVRFRVLGMGDIKDALFFLNKEKEVPIEVSPNIRSAFYSTTVVNGSFSIFRLVKKEADETKELIGEVKVANLKPPLLVVLRPLPKGKIEVGVSSDSVEDFPAGSFKFVNFSTLGMDLKMGKSIFNLLEGKTVVVDGAPLVDAGRIPIEVVTHAELPKTIYSSVWAFDPRMRVICYAVGNTTPTRPVSFYLVKENAQFK